MNASQEINPRRTQTWSSRRARRPGAANQTTTIPGSGGRTPFDRRIHRERSRPLRSMGLRPQRRDVPLLVDDHGHKKHDDHDVGDGDHGQPNERTSTPGRSTSGRPVFCCVVTPDKSNRGVIARSRASTLRKREQRPDRPGSARSRWPPSGVLRGPA